MAITTTWTIPTVERNLSDGGITVIHWLCQASDGEGNTWDAVGTTSHTPDPSAPGFISYDDVTLANCLGWAKAELDVEAIEASVTAQLQSVLTPVTASGTPWSD